MQNPAYFWTQKQNISFISFFEHLPHSWTFQQSSNNAPGSCSSATRLFICLFIHYNSMMYLCLFLWLLKEHTVTDSPVIYHFELSTSVCLSWILGSTYSKDMYFFLCSYYNCIIILESISIVSSEFAKPGNGSVHFHFYGTFYRLCILFFSLHTLHRIYMLFLSILSLLKPVSTHWMRARGWKPL